MKFKKIGGAALVMSMLFAGQAHAVDQDLVFTGLVLDSCNLVVGVGGVLALSTEGDVLGSSQAGGTSGTVIATTNSVNSTIEVIAPTAFTTGPSSADTNTTFDASYALSGITTLSEVVGTVVSPLGLGITTVSVDTDATKSGGSTFDAGAYTLTTTVRCTVP